MPAPQHDAQVARRLQIHGQVQGVGYRWSMAREAMRLGVQGWVRNRREGFVEALVAGGADAVQQLVAWARRGPPAASVSAVEVLPITHPVDVPEAFEQRPTV
ncbi:MAG: acylphosphatase [Rubrivivax sp.]|nr:acylphosphatase [Rubrivivax sp.]